MKKLISMLLVLVLALGIGAIALADGLEIGMITDIGTINDKSFNQGTWEGIVAYCQAQGMDETAYAYYQPVEKTTDSYLEKIEQAVADGAKVVVTPGFLFEPAIFVAQDMYPDVKFILIDGNPNNGDYDNFEAKTGDNAVGITYAEEQSGYLAGYAAVVEGDTKLGFMGGMAVPAVIRFGYGFVQGADAAAKELGISDVSINYHYTGNFDATPEAQALAASWYNDGVQTIFACGGAVGNSVMAAAEAAGTKVIGVDIDQSPESATVITSATKGLAASVEQMLDAFYNDSFPGGTNVVMGAANLGVGLPMETSKFETFDQAQYDALYAKLADGTIALQTDTDAEKADGLSVDIAKVTLID